MLAGTFGSDSSVARIEAALKVVSDRVEEEIGLSYLGVGRRRRFQDGHTEPDYLWEICTYCGYHGHGIAFSGSKESRDWTMYNLRRQHVRENPWCEHPLSVSDFSIGWIACPQLSHEEAEGVHRPMAEYIYGMDNVWGVTEDLYKAYARHLTRCQACQQAYHTEVVDVIDNSEEFLFLKMAEEDCLEAAEEAAKEERRLQKEEEILMDSPEDMFPFAHSNRKSKQKPQKARQKSLR